MLYYVASRKSIEELLSKIEDIQNYLGQVAENYIFVARDTEDLQVSVALLESWIQGKSKCYFDDIKQLILSCDMYEDTLLNFKRKIERCADYFAFMVPENKDDPMAYESIYNVMIDLSGNLLKELQGILENSKPRVRNGLLSSFKDMMPIDEFIAKHIQLDYNMDFQCSSLSIEIKKIDATDFMFLNHSFKENTFKKGIKGESNQLIFGSMPLSNQLIKYSEIIPPHQPMLMGFFIIRREQLLS